jgi:hypothetical protein
VEVDPVDIEGSHHGRDPLCDPLRGADEHRAVGYLGVVLRAGRLAPTPFTRRPIEGLEPVRPLGLDRLYVGGRDVAERMEPDGKARRS